jgi:hypothetical protein
VASEVGGATREHCCFRPGKQASAASRARRSEVVQGASERPRPARCPPWTTNAIRNSPLEIVNPDN